jgi:dipeptidase E
MRVLLGSGGYRTEERKQLLINEMKSFFGSISSILFVPYAIADHDGYVAKMSEKGFDAGYKLIGIHTFADQLAAIRDAEAIYVGGGNTFRLTKDLYKFGLLSPIRERIAGGVPYMGVSAGSNVACPTMQTTNDMPITMPPAFQTLGLVPFQVNAHSYPGMVHFKSGDTFHEHYGETRDDRIREFHEMNETPVVGLYEGAHIRVENGKAQLGGNTARVYQKGKEAQDIAAPASLDFLMK